MACGFPFALGVPSHWAYATIYSSACKQWAQDVFLGSAINQVLGFVSPSSPQLVLPPAININSVSCVWTAHLLPPRIAPAPTPMNGPLRRSPVTSVGRCIVHDGPPRTDPFPYFFDGSFPNHHEFRDNNPNQLRILTCLMDFFSSEAWFGAVVVGSSVSALECVLFLSNHRRKDSTL